jgi:GAF domain-containing protein
MAQRPTTAIDATASSEGASEKSAAGKDGGRALADGGDEGGSRDMRERERRRLETLREYRILDTAPEPAFDRVTKLAADLFDTPIALVSLVDDCRQWFKSSYGLDVPETPREISFCEKVVKSERPMIIADTLEDSRFRSNPLVTGEPLIRFYAGVPLRA